ncbi:MAG: ABC transporter permease [Candidatus Aminicenantes bacterium RBG_13_63_10]|nr:MAG: ABC transporter permease [Candidatus Aminicenantes bacterium RBG_13_63_10]
MTLFKLAIRNMLGAGTKTWLNALVLSFSFVAIIWAQSLFKGMDEEASRSLTDIEYGGGQYWVEGYDPLDPFTIQDAHRPVEGVLRDLVDAGRAAPILVVQGTIFPQGRMFSVLLKGIDPGQRILTLPTLCLEPSGGEIPALIGTRAARMFGLAEGDTVTVRWRDVGGTFDAVDVVVAGGFSSTAQSADSGQVWLPLEELRRMTGAAGQATLVVMEKGFSPSTAGSGSLSGWAYKDLDFLLRDIREFIQMKTVGTSIFYVLLMSLAMLAVFNTQVLSIWRRRREIGTMIAMGLTRGRVIALFTLEGSMLSFLAMLVGAVYGIPLLAYFAAHGWVLPSDQADSFGLALGNTLYPIYSAGIIVGTALLVFLITTVVSFLPTRRIAKLRPTEAIKGKLS